MKKISATDVAKKTGYAKSTIYAALKNNPTIGKETTAFIQKTAEEMGYSVDPVFSELGYRRWKNTPSPVGENLVFFMHETYLDILSKRLPFVKEYAQKRGYRVTFCTPSQFKSADHANRVFKAQGVRGIGTSFLSDQKTAELVAQLDLDRIAVITNETHRDLFHSIAWNWAEIISQSIQSLTSRGYKNISILLYNNDPLQFYDKQRLGAVHTEQMTQSATINLHSSTVPFNLDEKSQYQERQKELLQIIQQDQPDALLGWSAEQYWMLKDAGISIPQDLGYVALIADQLCSGPTVGYLAIWKLELDRIIDLIRNQEFGRVKDPIISLYTPKFVDRGTA